MLCGHKILSIFEVTNSITRAHNRPTAGHFLCPIQYGGSVLLNEGESPHSPGEGLVNGKGTTVYYLVSTLKKLAMTSNSPSGNATSTAIMATTILNDLLITDDVSRMRQHLRNMLDCYLLEEEDRNNRRQVYGTFLALDFMLVKSNSLVVERRII